MLILKMQEELWQVQESLNIELSIYSVSKN